MMAILRVELEMGLTEGNCVAESWSGSEVVINAEARQDDLIWSGLDECDEERDVDMEIEGD